jgi:hypothetical protein
MAQILGIENATSIPPASKLISKIKSFFEILCFPLQTAQLQLAPLHVQRIPFTMLQYHYQLCKTNK